ncbi:STAS-like domain-containing protein [Ochrobactrum sp. SFR4]|uniref:STAS-like domain-containing protein n=1 Tax=Ochrobactrum sp. SFR4 TaxID=2717368 RepID=UPI001C8CA263|nr:STAS-like domain-containing protein [Ochrobactrum sp. SFR4]MBX8825274.1 STAS-like domain-containing protein [Ochrobactrum sp. SFR4]
MMIDLANEFGKYPAGRFPTDGSYNGELFREKFLKPYLKTITEQSSSEKLIIDIDGVRAFGSSFIEEAFGGLIRAGLYTSLELNRLIEVKCTKPNLLFYKEMIQHIISISAKSDEEQ